MKSITLDVAFKLLEQAKAVIITIDGSSYDKERLATKSLSQLTDDEDNAFLYLEWKATYQSCTEFKQKDNEEVKMINNNQLQLIDYEGDKINLTLLVPMDLDKV